MITKFTRAQMLALEAARHRYTIARKLGTARQTALEIATAAYSLEAGIDRERAAHVVTAFIAMQPELPVGSL